MKPPIITEYRRQEPAARRMLGRNDEFLLAPEV
jgi:hypothetical protein